MSPRGKPLADEQYAAVAWADPSESTVVLCRHLGVEYETVRLDRERMARAGGWGCDLVVLIYPACNHPLLVAARQIGANQRRRHPDFQQTPLARHTRDRVRRVAGQRRQRTRAVMRATSQRDLPRTEPSPFRDHVPWAPDEEARLRERMDRPVQELSEELGRSPSSISMRRSRLRRHAT